MTLLPWIIGILCIVAIGSQDAVAQTEKTSDAASGAKAKGRARMMAQDMPDKRLNLMTRNLGLTKEQQKKIRPILLEEEAQLEALRGDDSFNRDERRAKLQELNEATYEKIRPILTPDQHKKHEMAKQVIRENRTRQKVTKSGPKMTDNDPDSRIARLTEDLGLSKEQQAKILPILQEEFEQLKTLPGNDSLNRDQRRTKLQQLNEATYEKIKPILTPEQQQKHDEIRKKIAERRFLKKSTAASPEDVKK